MRILAKDRIGQKFGMLTIMGVYMSGKYSMAKVLCECGNENNVRICALTSDNTISCGCKRKSDFNERNKTDEKVLRDGREITLRNYLYFHRRLVAKYGKPQKCEFNTTHLAKRFEYALKKDSHYSDNRDDYFELCPSCHRKYDYKPEYGAKSGETQRGVSKPSVSQKLTGRIRSEYWVPVIQKNKDGGFVRKYNSIEEASELTGIIRTGILNVLSKRASNSGGFLWEYA